MNIMKQISRREIMVGGAATVATLGVGGDVRAKAIVDPLVELERQRNEIQEEASRRQDQADELEDRLGFTALQEQSDALWERSFEIEEQIRSTPATTVEGLAVKLRVTLEKHRTQGAEEDLDWDVRLLLAATRDAERLAA